MAGKKQKRDGGAPISLADALTATREARRRVLALAARLEETERTILAAMAPAPATPATTPTPAKRPVGRPSKPATPAPAKRPVGRPPKAATPAPAKRPVGRPRTRPAAAPATRSTAGRRPVGRPPKG